MRYTYKGGNYLEALAKAEIVVFDKTGTLTKGVFNVTAVHPQIISEQRLIELAAYAEVYSSHPISRSIIEAFNAQIDKSRISDVKEISGRGIKAVIDGKDICVGNGKLMDDIGVSWHPCIISGQRFMLLQTAYMPDISLYLIKLRRIRLTR